MDNPLWKEGDRVIWRHDISPSQMSLIPGIVRRINDKSVTVEVLLRLGSEWVRERRTVESRSLAHRTKHVPSLDGKKPG